MSHQVVEQSKLAALIFDPKTEPELTAGLLVYISVFNENYLADLYAAAAASWKKAQTSKGAAKRDGKCSAFGRVMSQWVRYRFRVDFLTSIEIKEKKSTTAGMLVDLVPKMIKTDMDDSSVQMTCSKISLALLRAGRSARSQSVARSKKLRRIQKRDDAAGEANGDDDERDEVSDKDSPCVSPNPSPPGSPSSSRRSSDPSERSKVPQNAAVMALKKEASGSRGGLVPSLSAYGLDEIADGDDSDDMDIISPKASQTPALPIISQSAPDDTPALLSPPRARPRSQSMFSTVVSKSKGALARAQYLTMLEADLFRAITPVEFTRMAWQKGDKEVTSPNILRSLEFFNNLSFYISLSVCSSMDVEGRIAMVKQHLQLAELCFTLGNFSSIMAIIGGLNNVAVQRMKKTWAGISTMKKLWTRLNVLMDSKQNYAKYRSALDDFRQNKRPCVPFLGVYLRDITFLEEGNEDFVDEKKGRLHADKFRMMGQLFLDFEWYQNQTLEYSFKTKREAKQFWKANIVAAPDNKDELLYEMSCTVVPRKDAGAT